MFASRLCIISLGTVLLAMASSALPTTSTTQNLSSLERRVTIPLTPVQTATFKPYTYYAAAAYCNPSSILAWNCGAACNANSGFKPVAAGGDGGVVQFWFVGYDPSLQSIIVGFQGSDIDKIYPIVTNANFRLEALRSDLFPGIGNDIKVHNGFAQAQAGSASNVLSAVRSAMSTYGTNKVTVLGHSLGGAISTISVVHLKVNLPPNTSFRLITYGTPRIGNQAFVNYVNSNFPNTVTRITNRDDLIPTLPGRFLGYAHVIGEIHILDDLTWVSCPGQDNTDSKCTIGYVPNIFAGKTGDHKGPYDGVLMRCQ